MSQETPNPEWLVQDIFPTGEVHLLVGPSGSGKTTYLFQFARMWREGKVIFGQPSYPAPYVYISCDRSLKNVMRTLKRLNEPADFDIMSGIDRRDLESMPAVLRAVKKEYPLAKVLFVEGMASMLPGGKINDYDTVARFLRDLARHAAENDITIIGVVHSAKTKEGEQYLNPRERILGSVAWAAFSETILYFDPVKPGDASQLKYRNLWVLPRNAAEQMFEMEMIGGRLVGREKEPVVSARDTAGDKIMRFLQTLDPDGEFSLQEAIDYAETSRQTVHKVISNLFERGIVERASIGVYKYTPLNSKPAKSKVN